jgi:hypothetical protein
MAFDIYGGNLQRGHCEVHPHVHEEYPCSVCLSESRRKRDEQREYQRHCEEQAAAYYAELAGDEEYESWSRA